MPTPDPDDLSKLSFGHQTLLAAATERALSDRLAIALRRLQADDSPLTFNDASDVLDEYCRLRSITHADLVHRAGLDEEAP